MPYSVAVLSVLMGLVASPTGTSAQTEEGAGSEPPGAGVEPVLEEPALQLELDDAGVGVTPSPPRTSDGYTLEEAEVRVKGAKVGVIMSVIPLVVGGILLGVSGAQICVLGSCEDMLGPGMAIGGGVMMGVGVAGMVGFGVMLSKRNSDLESLKS